MIAQRIRQMVGADTGKAEQIYDKQQNCLRDVQYRDVVVLMRSLAKKANDYVEVLRLAGVPVSCQATAGYFQATEISDILSLLKVLDNPQRDIELAAVLRSPIFNVSDTELARIKIHSKIAPPPSENPKSEIRNPNFWNCVLQYSGTGSDAKLAARLKEILAWLEDWRTLARRGSLADLIWEVYRQTNFLSFVSALPNGQARRANLLKLHDRAIQFEGFATSAGIPSLTRFVEFLEKLLEAGQDWAPAEPQTAAGNAVRILSVHKSKGLEFPVVFLAELETKFNKEDTFGDCLADAKYTVGLQIIDRDSNSILRSLAHQVIAEEKLKTALAEEMRILYVATTRAKDRLILTSSQKHGICRRTLTSGFFFCDRPISDWQLRSCSSPLEWLLLGLSDQKVLHDAFDTGLAKTTNNDLFSFKLYNQSWLQQLSKFVLGLKAGKSAKRPHHTEGGQVADKSEPVKLPAQGKAPPKLLSQIKKSFGWQYQFGDAPDLPAKSSVTELTHRSDEYVQFDYSRALDRQPAALAAKPDLARPAEPRLIGTATHLVISHLDLACPISRESIEKTIEKLLADSAITATVAEHIDTESILAFFDSDLGKIVLDNSKNVFRDWPFTFALPASELPNSILDSRTTNHEPRTTHDAPRTPVPPALRSPAIQGEVGSAAEGTQDETIVVQGIIDMLIQTPQGLVIIDFKTDDISAGQVASRAELYRSQLTLYARAASAILKSSPLAKWLYFLTPSRAIEV
jgi:ATP-dependent helicase/nuclease subunit A